MKIFIFRCVFLTFACSANAQAGKFSFGLKSGINISSYDIKYNDQLSYVGSLTSSGTITRFNIGAYVNVSLLIRQG